LSGIPNSCACRKFGGGPRLTSYHISCRALESQDTNKQIRRKPVSPNCLTAAAQAVQWRPIPGPRCVERHDGGRRTKHVGIYRHPKPDKIIGGPRTTFWYPRRSQRRNLLVMEWRQMSPRPPPGRSNQPGRLGRGSGNSDRVLGANRVVWALSEAAANERNNAVGGAWCPACVRDSRRHRQGLETCTSVAEGASSGTNLAWRSIATSHHAGGHFNSVL
jgi:hypothetical protein